MTTLPYGMSALESAGNLDNFRRIVGDDRCAVPRVRLQRHRHLQDARSNRMVSRSEADADTRRLHRRRRQLLSRVQAERRLPQQLRAGSTERRRDTTRLAESHELYSAGHYSKPRSQTSERPANAGCSTSRSASPINWSPSSDRAVATTTTDTPKSRPRWSSCIALTARTGAYLDLAKQFIDNRGQRIFAGRPAGRRVLPGRTTHSRGDFDRRSRSTRAVPRGRGRRRRGRDRRHRTPADFAHPLEGHGRQQALHHRWCRITTQE